MHRKTMTVSLLVTLLVTLIVAVIVERKIGLHFEHILNGCPENGPSSPKTYKIFEANFRKVDFFQNFDNENFQYHFKYELLMF